MPMFGISGERLSAVEQINFSIEKDLQCLIQQNLDVVFNCRFVASEFSTGDIHSGRIDTLALSEDNNPVIIEYKKKESSELITQSLFYLQWIHDHKGDFQVAVNRSLEGDIEVDWSDVRVICIAPDYKKYDLHAVKVMGTNIELWRYRKFNNQSLYLESVHQSNRRPQPSISVEDGKNPVMVEAGRKAAISRATGQYTIEEHLEGKSETIHGLVNQIREFMTSLDTAIEEAPKKKYVAYKISQNIVCMEILTKQVKLYVKLSTADVLNPPPIYRDVTGIGHYGTGNAAFTIATEEEFEQAKPFIELAYNKIGG